MNLISQMTYYVPTVAAYGAVGGLAVGAVGGLAVGAVVGGPVGCAVGGAVGLMKMGLLSGGIRRLGGNAISLINKNVVESLKPKTPETYINEYLGEGGHIYRFREVSPEWSEYKRKCASINKTAEFALYAFRVMAIAVAMLYVGGLPVSATATVCTFAAVYFAPRVGMAIVDAAWALKNRALCKA